MNVEQLKKNVGTPVRIRPIAKRQEASTGQFLEPKDDNWYINRVASGVVDLQNSRTGHVASLGNDCVREYRSTAHLRLSVQLTLRGQEVLREPIWGP
jgi:hypothetical protein